MTRTDTLQAELDHGRLSPLAFAAGRGLETAFERARRPGGSGWSERVDTAVTSDDAIVQSLEAAAALTRSLARVERIVGAVDAGIIRAVLGEGLTFDQVAARLGKTGARGSWYAANRFRDALEALAVAPKATGAPAPNVRDKYSEAAGAIARKSA